MKFLASPLIVASALTSIFASPSLLPKPPSRPRSPKPAMSPELLPPMASSRLVVTTPSFGHNLLLARTTTHTELAGTHTRIWKTGRSSTLMSGSRLARGGLITFLRMTPPIPMESVNPGLLTARFFPSKAQLEEKISILAWSQEHRSWEMDD
ncbi:hypothetical protein QC763_306157 [Podospora pseudopauciseta]|uniref:Uncharacterized protein n=1 Tax=Podospora pseudopauciseta TaxID=2093780 RepID=A0ABR0HG87_9PEZI|nr:hypothetical protein QC763_306157 [Podospora pseudopauciseta]